MPSRPELLQGREVGRSRLQVRPLSLDVVLRMTWFLLLQRAWIVPSLCINKAGWMASKAAVTPSSLFGSAPAADGGGVGTAFAICQVRPPSGLSSKHICQPLPSLLLGQISVPSAATAGWFLIGPRKPSGSAAGLDQVYPPSLLRSSQPFQLAGLGPTL